MPSAGLRCGSVGHAVPAASLRCPALGALPPGALRTARPRVQLRLLPPLSKDYVTKVPWQGHAVQEALPNAPQTLAAPGPLPLHVARSAPTAAAAAVPRARRPRPSAALSLGGPVPQRPRPSAALIPPSPLSPDLPLALAGGGDERLVAGPHRTAAATPLSGSGSATARGNGPVQHTPHARHAAAANASARSAHVTTSPDRATAQRAAAAAHHQRRPPSATNHRTARRPHRPMRYGNCGEPANGSRGGARPGGPTGQ